MTPETQRIAIAVACGWNATPDQTSNHAWGVWAKKPVWSFIHQLPDYLNDLNAMHKIEAGRYWGETDVYQHHLENITFAVGIRVWHATAAHRAEAFLKSIEKWKVKALASVGKADA